MLQDPSKACPRQLVKSRSSLPSFCVIVRARFSPLRPTTSTNLIKSSSILNSLVLKYTMQIVSYCLTDKSVISSTIIVKKLILFYFIHDLFSNNFPTALGLFYSAWLINIIIGLNEIRRFFISKLRSEAWCILLIISTIRLTTYSK